MTTSGDDYRAASSAFAWIDRSDRLRMAITGPDRVKFLQNLTTNDVKRLGAGQGCEAFVTSLQGKTLGYVTLHLDEDRILLRTERCALESVQPHFQKYGVFDDVRWDDESESTREVHLAGPSAEATVRETLGVSTPESEALTHIHGESGGFPILVVREAITGRAGLTLIGPSAAIHAVVGQLEKIRPALERETFEALRIEAGTPIFGCDVTPDNLPQEIGRDRQAINFVKGCYLGQETVARIDALGHVNKVQRGLRIVGDRVPDRGVELEADGKTVGRITSAAYSPGWRSAVALGFVRTSHAEAGKEVTVVLGPGEIGTAVVKELPMLPPAE
jgi:folate-binding protein YgfZ